MAASEPAVVREPATKDSQGTEEEGSQQEKEGKGEEEMVKEEGAAATSDEIEDPIKAKRATFEVCMYITTLNAP